MKKTTLILSALSLLLFCNLSYSQISSPVTLEFSPADNTNLGPIVNDGEGGSTDIAGVQIDITAIHYSTKLPTNVDFIFASNIPGKPLGDGLSDNIDPLFSGMRAISIKTNDGTEFDFNGIDIQELIDFDLTLTVEGFRDGVSIGTTGVFVDEGFHERFTASDFSDLIFGNVDEVHIIGTFSFYGTFNSFVLGAAVATSNSAPTATAPTAPTVNQNDANVALANDIQVADTDGDDQTVVFTITGGKLTIGTAGISFSSGSNGSASFTAAGTLSAINTALDAATFTPIELFSGTNAGSISFTTSDLVDTSSAATVTFDITDNTNPTLVSAIKDSNTKITVHLSENVQTTGSNPTDFTVVDANAVTFAVTAQTDGTVGDNDIVLMVADMSSAVGNLVVTYTNNNNEIKDLSNNTLATDGTGATTNPSSTSVINGPVTLDFLFADDTNLGTAVKDGEGGSTDIAGVQIDIVSIDKTTKLPNDLDFIFADDLTFGLPGDGLYGHVDPGYGTLYGISLSTNDGSEFDFNGINMQETLDLGSNVVLEGFKDGVSTGSVVVLMDDWENNTYTASDFPDAKFGNVDEVKIYAQGGFMYNTFNRFVLGAAVVTNNAPTASNVAFTGTLEIDQDITGTYTYADVDTDTENGTTFKWYRSDDNSGTNKAAISGATASTYTLVAADAGKYISFEVVPKDGIDFGTAVESNLQGPINYVLGINTTSIIGFSMYPNPVRDLLNISAQEQIKRIEIYNLLGQRVVYRNSNNVQISINISHLSQGSYFVKVFTDKAFISIKLIKN